MNAGLGGATAGHGLAHYVIKLLRLRWVILYSSFRRAKTRGKIGWIALSVAVLAFAAFLFWVSWALLGALRSPELRQYVDPGPLLAAIPTLAISLAFFVILLTNFGVLLQALYLAGDMDFLMSAPLPTHAVFLSKLLQAILPNFGLVCLFTLPLLFGLGVSSGYSLLYYPLVVVMLSVIALAAAGLTSLLVMAVVRVIPARRVAEVLGFLAAILAVTLGQTGQITRNVNVSPDQATGALQGLARLNSSWSPLAWGGNGLLAIGEGRWLAGAGLSLVFVALFAGAFVIALQLAEKLYYTGWARMQGNERRKKAPRKAAAPAAALPGRVHLLPAPVRALIVKDFLLLRRDLRNLSQVITPLILGFIFLFTQRPERIPVGENDLARFGLTDINLYINLIFALFVGWMLMLNLSLTAISREGKQYWMLKAAPLRSGTLLAAKYLVAYLPTFLLAMAFTGIAYLIRPLGLIDLGYSLVIIALILAGLAGIMLAFGVAGARLDWEDPRQMGARGTTGCVSMLASIAYLGVSLALFALPQLLMSLFLGPGGQAAGRAIGLALGAAFSLACALIAPRLVAGRLPRLGED